MRTLSKVARVAAMTFFLVMSIYCGIYGAYFLHAAVTADDLWLATRNLVLASFLWGVTISGFTGGVRGLRKLRTHGLFQAG